MVAVSGAPAASNCDWTCWRRGSAIASTSGSALALGSGPYTSTGEKADHAVLMCRIDNTVSGGLTPSETITLAWDEI